MKKTLLYPLYIGFIYLAACSPAQKLGAAGDDGKIEITLMQINDVYEIAPLEGGKTGGLARVATVKKDLLRDNPNTLLVIAGDFLSPSVYNSLKHNGTRIRGKQMVEAMNAAGVDLAVFGNHEFDVSEADLQSRINESEFKWISSNTFHKKGNEIVPFEKQNASGTEPFPETYIMHTKDADGTTAKVGFISVTLPYNKAAYVSYTDVFTAAQKAYDSIKDSCDVVVAITHQLLEDDIKLAKQIPGLALIIGGHEHERYFSRVGNVFITKADANAKSAYVLKLKLNAVKHNYKVESNLVEINEKVALDSATDVVVKRWTAIADNSYSALGFDAPKVALLSGEPLDGRDAYVRAGETNFTKLIVAGMEKASPDADLVIVNAGSLRVDDILQMPVTQYDILRSLPFGGSIMEADIKGSLLIKLLNAGEVNRGTGGLLHHSPKLTRDSITGNWALSNTNIDAGKTYKVAMTDFLITGGEANMGFFTKDNPDVVKVYPVYTDVKDARSDIRRAIINYMEGLGK